MSVESQYDDQPAESYWAGVHIPHVGTIATTPVTEDDLRLLDMLDYVDHLPLTESDYRGLSGEERDRISIDEGVALQTYREFMNRYGENPDQFNAAIQELLPVNVVAEQLDGDPYTVYRYLTEEGQGLFSEEADAPDQYEWGEFVDEKGFVTEADVLYAQTQDEVEKADPVRALINLKFAKGIEHLKGWRDNMGDNMEMSEEHPESLAEHTESWAEAQELTIEQLEQINEELEELPEDPF